jgi:Flp pilus assembly pilin Flp
LRDGNVLPPRGSDAGASAVEYALIVTAIAAVIVIIAVSLGGLVQSMFTGSCERFSSQTQTGSC